MSAPNPQSPAVMLADKGLAKLISKTLRVHGTPAQDIEDARQDVYVKVLVAIQHGAAPANLDEMAALCAKIAYCHAMSVLRKLTVRAQDMVAGCEPDELAPLNAHVEQRDPIDAGRELEVLAQLFREGRMPADGVDILEGVASRCTWAEIATPLEISEDLAEWRYREMKERYRRRMAKLGLLPDMIPLRLIVSKPGAIARLRQVA
jgi:DNA-directed RNA polymerase specialized sigma24 family protein